MLSIIDHKTEHVHSSTVQKYNKMDTKNLTKIKTDFKIIIKIILSSCLSTSTQAYALILFLNRKMTELDKLIHTQKDMQNHLQSQTIIQSQFLIQTEIKCSASDKDSALW